MTFRPFRVAALATLLTLGGSALSAQQQKPTSAQAQALLHTRPDLVAKLQAQMAASGLPPDQIRARLRAEGYSENLLDAYMPGAAVDSTGVPSDDVFAAMKSLGIADPTTLDSLRSTARNHRQLR